MQGRMQRYIDRAFHKPSDTMNIVVDEVPCAIVVRLHGEAEFIQAGLLNLRLRFVLARRPNLVILDISDLKLLSDQCREVLNTFRRDLHEQDGEVRLVGLPRIIRRGFDQAEWAPVYADLPMALADDCLTVGS